MVPAILVLLGLFVIFGVCYNIFSFRKRQNNDTKKPLFSNASKNEKIEIMKVSSEDLNLEPIIDETVIAYEEKQAAQPDTTDSLKSQDPEESSLVSIYVMNQPLGSVFPPYELIQALAGANCHYGEMSIFHRHEQLSGSGDVLFSIAQAVTPGIFNLGDIGSIKCPGLILFMDAAMTDDPYFIFNTMLETAEQLAQDLQAGLFQTPTEAMTHRSQNYYERKLNYAKKERERLKEMT